MNTKKTLIALALVAASAPAFSATITISNLRSDWLNPVPVANATITNQAGSLVDTVRWPATGTPQSGYDFDPTDGSVVLLNVPPTSPGFQAGVFRHLNQPIPSGTSITNIQLRITGDLDIDGTKFLNQTYLYNIAHLETPNDANPCANGGVNGVGLNINGCADRVSITPVSGQQSTFKVGNVDYTIFLDGFSTGGIADPDPNYWTIEQATNTANLVGHVGASPSTDLLVPEPGGLALTGLALAGLGLIRRRKTSV